MATLEQSRSHSGGHHHHDHDNTFLTSSDKNDAGVRITRIGLYTNLGMAIGKAIGGYAFHSQALLADAVHSLTDLIADFMTLATVSWALKPPSDQFPYGFGKVESLGSLGVSGILLFGGLFMGYSALFELCQIYAPSIIEFAANVGILGCLPEHSHHVPDMGAAWLAGGSVLIKEWLYRATMKVAKERKSAVLAANAVHHRVDSLTGIAALVSIAVSNLFPSFAAMDALGGLVISWMVISAGWENTQSSLAELADATIGDDVKAKVNRIAAETVTNITTAKFSVGDVQGTKAGQNYLIEIELQTEDNDVSLRELEDIEEAVRDAVGRKVRGARRVRVRFVSTKQDGFAEEFISPDVMASVRSTPEPEEHNHENGSSKKNI